MRGILLGLALVAGSAAAQDAGFGQDIPPEEWRAMAQGHSLTYEVEGQFWALEHYAKDGDRVTLQTYDGECLEGRWAHEDGAYCFYWEAEPPHCFRHVRAAGQIFVIHVKDGVETGAIQTMTGVTDTGIVCNGLVS